MQLWGAGSHSKLAGKQSGTTRLKVQTYGSLYVPSLDLHLKQRHTGTSSRCTGVCGPWRALLLRLALPRAMAMIPRTRLLWILTPNYIQQRTQTFMHAIVTELK